jgi:hypothetical protein
MTNNSLIVKTLQKLDKEIPLNNGVVFSAVVDKLSAEATEEVFYFKAGTSPVRFVLIDLFFNAGQFSKWEAWINPTVATDGVEIDSVNSNSDSGELATAKLFTNPTGVDVTAAKKIRTFALNSEYRFNIINPYFKLAANDSLVIRRLSLSQSVEIISNWQWIELTE